jgi:hypothetical protein
LFFGQDAVEGEPLMALALMRGAGRRQPHANFVDRGFQHLPRRVLGVDG